MHVLRSSTVTYILRAVLISTTCLSVFFWSNPFENVLLLCALGKGYPKYLFNSYCTFIFHWETSYACIAKPPECQIHAGKSVYNLSPLTRTSYMGMLSDNFANDVFFEHFYFRAESMVLLLLNQIVKYYSCLQHSLNKFWTQLSDRCRWVRQLFKNLLKSYLQTFSVHSIDKWYFKTRQLTLVSSVA